MFDVPPPENGVRGIDAYRETWQPFFRWLAEGAIFEIEELHVTAGALVPRRRKLVRECSSNPR
jgi:ketosteroid isomerase-like protein